MDFPEDQRGFNPPSLVAGFLGAEEKRRHPRLIFRFQPGQMVAFLRIDAWMA